jgi:hypothetical protein
MNIDSQEPPNEKQRHKGQQKMSNPLARRGRSAEIEHPAMVALPVPASLGVALISTIAGE